MSVLRKDMTPVVRLGTPAVAGTPGRAAGGGYWTTERVTRYEWRRTSLTNDDYKRLQGTGAYKIIGRTVWQWVPITETKRVWVPPWPAVPAVPAKPATPTTIEWLYNEGWDNCCAVSIAEVGAGLGVRFKISQDDSGAFVGLGPGAAYGQPVAAFSVGVMADASGIYVHEQGKNVTRLADNIVRDYTVRIMRGKNGSVRYVLFERGAIIADHTGAAALPPKERVFAFGYLYRGGDEIRDAAIVPGRIVEEPAASVLHGRATLLALPRVRAWLRGRAALTVRTTGARLSGRARLTVKLPMPCRIEGWLPPLFGKLAHSKTFGEIDGKLPALTGRLAKSYTPPKRTSMDLYLPSLAFSGRLTTIRRGRIEGTLPRLSGKLAESRGFGEINGTLPPLLGILEQDMEPNTGSLFDGAILADGMDAGFAHVVFVNERGDLLTEVSATKMAAAAMAEILSAADWLEVIGSFAGLLETRLLLTDAHSATVIAGQIERPDLDETARVWVVNVETGATVQYDGYGFQSFFARDGKHYGVAPDGIYELEGDTDAGWPIDALIDWGVSTWGTHQRKRVANVYAAAVSADTLLLRVEADGVTMTYAARSSERCHLKHHRFDLGRGLAGTHWHFELLNKDGRDFDLESVVFEPIILSRKI